VKGKAKAKAIEPVVVSPPSSPLSLPADHSQALDIDQIADEEEEELPSEPREEVVEEEVQQFSIDVRYSAVAGRDELPASTRTRREAIVGNVGYGMFDIEEYQTEVLLRQRPKRYKVLNIRLTASYEGMREGDKVRSDVYEERDLDDVLAAMRSWNRRFPTKALILTVLMKCEEEKEVDLEAPPPPSAQQPASQARVRQEKKRLTETQRQENAIAFMTQAEAAGDGGFYKQFNERWICKNSHCKNLGYTCWRNTRPGQTDNAANHYKVQGPLLQKWMKEVQDGNCELDSPRTDLVVTFIKAKEKIEIKPTPTHQASDIFNEAGVTLGQFSQLLMAQMMSNMTTQLSPRLATPTTTTSPPNAQPPPNSSPIRSRIAPEDLTAEFFAWVRAQPGQQSDRRQNLLYLAEEKLVENDWELSALQQSAPVGRRITEQRWREYELPDGLLVSLRTRLHEWRMQRPRSSASSTNGEVVVE